ncbi:single-stranded DNA-binding protein [Bifidobacterium colobi]|uniref:single-stranded DNA-binding protein n=1 Tax=Bifidobacterium colobi TaxID=2809026 RepID=UPI001F0AB633|nr:single-stranded DNA-binding protein [Bifidobacterium colobi]
MANQQASVTMTGFVAGDLVKGGNDNFVVATFRMGSTRSRLNPNTKQWEEFGTVWLTVKSFRSLANNVLQSIRRGDRIIVVGVLNTEQWTNEHGEPRSRTVLEATNIGHDLMFGTTNLTKSQRQNGNSRNAAVNGNANGNAVPPSATGIPGGAADATLPQQTAPPVELGDGAFRQDASDPASMCATMPMESGQDTLQQTYDDEFAEEAQI